MSILRALAAAAVILVSGPVAAQECMSVAAMMNLVTETYGERPVAGGTIARANAPMIILANPETGTWTAIAKMPNGCAVPVLVGEGWVMVNDTPPLPGEDA